MIFRMQTHLRVGLVVFGVLAVLSLLPAIVPSFGVDAVSSCSPHPYYPWINSADVVGGGGYVSCSVSKSLYAEGQLKEDLSWWPDPVLRWSGYYTSGYNHYRTTNAYCSYDDTDHGYFSKMLDAVSPNGSGYSDADSGRNWLYVQC